MSLVGDPRSQPFLHSGLRGVGFGMIANGGEAHQHVRVVVTFEALAEVGHADTSIIPFPAALEFFRSFQHRIEAAASAKFETIGPELQAFEGVPTVLLMTGDPI